MLSVMERSKKAIEQDIAIISFHHPGISFDDGFVLSSEQRQLLASIVKKHQQAMSGKEQIIG